MKNAGPHDQVQNAKWEILDFSPRIRDNNIKDGCFPNRYRFTNEDLIHKNSIEVVVKFH